MQAIERHDWPKRLACDAFISLPLHWPMSSMNTWTVFNLIFVISPFRFSFYIDENIFNNRMGEIILRPTWQLWWALALPHWKLSRQTSGKVPLPCRPLPCLSASPCSGLQVRTANHRAHEAGSVSHAECTQSGPSSYLAQPVIMEINFIILVYFFNTRGKQWETW